MRKRWLSVCLTCLLTAGVIGLNGCGGDSSSSSSTKKLITDSATIESALNLANNEDQEWTYDSDADAWVLSVVDAVVDPVLPGYQGVSVAVPGPYVVGIDTDGDGDEDVTAQDYSEAVNGSLVIDYTATITSTYGQVYSAATAPVIINTGAAGYGDQADSEASTGYASEGYINMACGNRGKQSYVDVDEDGSFTAGTDYYTGDAPSCLVDQKNATRFVKYNILLGNLPGSVDYFVSTGGSGGGAHASMFAATSNNSDFYDYEIEAGAVGVYQYDDGSYSTTVTINGTNYDISDGAWGCIAYSAITSLYEADMTMAFEYYLDPTYEFNTPFQAQLAEYLAASYMTYINDKNLSVAESAVGFDLNGDGDTSDTVALTIQHNITTHPETNGYYGTYLDLYHAEFTENLQWYLNNLEYADGWTWYDNEDSDGDGEYDTYTVNSLMTLAEKQQAFIEGRYIKASSSDGMMGGGPPGGGPTDGSTASSSGGSDSSNYDSFAAMLASYQEDIDDVYAGDIYGKNIVALYHPLNYIGAEGTTAPTWTRILMGASEGDISMFNSLNLQIAWLNNNTDAVIEWQWNGGHVPSEIFSESFTHYVDQMYGKYVDGAVTDISASTADTTDGTEEYIADEDSDDYNADELGDDISSWVDYADLTAVSFSLEDAAAYRTAGASKAIPGFDVMDYGQEDYVFGTEEVDARHWDIYVLDVFNQYADTLSELFNQEDE